MPIRLPHPIKAPSEQTFHQLDYDVMALAFEVHNQLGRFYDERIYQTELKQKVLSKGLEVESELEIRLIHKNRLKKMMYHSPFKYLYWIHLNHSKIQFTTLGN